MKSFKNILPKFLAVILIIGLMLAVLKPEIISKVIGEQTGWLGMLGATVVGRLPLFLDLLLSLLLQNLLKAGDGIMQVTAFITALMAVGCFCSFPQSPPDEGNLNKNLVPKTVAGRPFQV